ncbi:MAG: hypothetical protein AB7F86_07085 [Bdellovibrionales bacterium]
MGKNKGLVFSGMAFELVAMSIGGYYVGEYVDHYYGWKATASTYLVLILLIGWFIHLIYLLMRFERENEDGGPES